MHSREGSSVHIPQPHVVIGMGILYSWGGYVPQIQRHCPTCGMYPFEERKFSRSRV